MKITDTVKLSDEALASTITIVGRPGVGKTYAAKGVVEKMLAAMQRVCIIDPTGAWFGIRISADGTGPGFPVVIFGGDHADVPIDEEAGAALGELVATQHMQCIVDLSGMTPRAQCVFVAAFLLAIYVHTDRQPLQLVIDEADEFAPQSPKSSEAVQSLEQVDRCARRGRIRGIRPMLITQRLAVLSKDVFSASWTLISLGVSLPADRKAVKDWMEAKLDKQQAAELVDSLSKLKRGEGWVCFPPDEVLARVHFPKIRTFDSSSSPTAGQNLKVTTAAAELDLSAITQAMQASIEKANAADPKKLRERVAELEQQLAERPGDAVGTEVMDDLQAAQVERDQLRNEIAGMRRDSEELLRFSSAVSGMKEAMHVALQGAAAYVRQSQERLGSIEFPEISIQTEPTPIRPAPMVKRIDLDSIQPTSEVQRPSPSRAPVGRAAETARPSGEKGELSGPQARILAAIAFWKSLQPRRHVQPSRSQVAVVAGYTPSGGSYRTLLSELRTLGAIDYVGDDGLDFTTAGRDLATKQGWPLPITTRSQLHSAVMAKCSEPQRKIMSVLLGAGGRAVAREDLAQRAGYQMSGSFRTLLSELSTLGLIHYPSKSTAQAEALLFPEGLR